ncbi:phage terminase small subunit P27 family [Alicyclobacillus fodiniaquatilis]|uniref:Phage terminase small subunit P27 family n=1 Tax=Alicyclobacillus fodiniaquatilis TaxID=1661150 RepID=A0ABW4JHE5_9BACL
MAGQRQPIDLLLIKGKKHLTKSEVEERKSCEIRAPADKVKAPSYLDKECKKEFNKLAKQLVEIGIMSNLDVDALARFVLAQKMYLRVTQELLEVDPMIRRNDGTLISANNVYANLLQSQDKLFKQCRQAASDLGLTISSRCRLALPKKEEVKELTEEEKLFGGKV